MSKEVSQLYWGDSKIIYLYLICLIMLVFFFKQNKKGKDIFLLYTILVYAVIYNPIFIDLSFGLFLSDVNEYVRVYYMLPHVFMMVYVLTEMVSNVEKKKRNFCIVAVCVLFMVLGNGHIQERFFLTSENIYKISDKAIKLSESLIEDEDGDIEVVFAGFEDSNQGDDVYYGIRQYTSNIKFVSMFLSEKQINEIYFSDVEAALTWLPFKMDDEYLICDYTDELCNKLENLGFEKILTVDNIKVFKYK